MKRILIVRSPHDLPPTKIIMTYDLAVCWTDNSWCYIIKNDINWIVGTTYVDELNKILAQT